jgi:putative transcriptional regulator
MDYVRRRHAIVGHRDAIRFPEVQRMKNRIRVLRAERDWSQAEVADRLGIARQTVNALEAGKYAPSLPLAFKISKLFQQPVEDIFDSTIEE